ncbi:phosphoribosylamine--glycine ligase [Capillibacterium thermochitinicola]|uniref:Phosphoribosylamine--glycine ligase n=1 Tax=Capillibacterium thermochitinicola TaxID=2699427 RepID=A0A8J6HZN0_9FIRM|nr:phosphoribosylamine--glycine ligase [Capillibacterium thermochitinicola]MBA2133015.1 phosphoribosylamine--glycine ligase [Capillibacterium thermochitinicola]
MRVLIVGSGGREHALAWKIKQSPLVREIFCAPGNAGIAHLARCVPLAADDIEALLGFARERRIDLTVVGPEAPLAAGIVDRFQAEGLAIFGPVKAAAQLEASKVFAKQLMAKYRIPTAESRTFTTAEEACAYIREKGAPLVIKADGLAAGKGVVVAATVGEAEAAVRRMLVDQEFGAAGRQIVIEEYLRGEELTLLAFTDGTTIVPMVAAQDHKAVYDNDTGPNTGGMGAYSPVPLLTPELQQQIETEILRPTINGLRQEGIVYQGVLYAGLMITADGPKVLEYNARFGDPECQVILPRLQSDLIPIIQAIIDRRLTEQTITWHDHHTACVVMTSGGYPGPYATGKRITGLEQVAAMPDVYVFHAGTAFQGEDLVTAGGRVLAVTAWGKTRQDALDKAYQAVRTIHFDGAHYRTDIGRRGSRLT